MLREPPAAPLGTEPVSASVPARREPARLAVAATALAGLLCLFRLGHKSLWLDEGYTLGHTLLPWDEFWRILSDREVNGALHSLLMFPWVRVSQAEWWVRLPSVAFSVATVAVMYPLLRRLVDTRTAAVGALLLAGNAFFLEYAQEARTYALLTFLTTLSTYFLMNFLRTGQRTAWRGWVVSGALLPYAQFFGLLVLGVQAVGVLGLRRGLPTDRRRISSGFAVIGIAALPVVLFVVAGGDQGQALYLPGVSAVRFVGVFARLAGNGGLPLMLPVGAACAYAVVVVLRNARVHKLTEKQWAVAYLVCWLLLPIVLMAVLSPVKPLFTARYFVICLPALAGLTAVGLTRMPAAWWRNALAGAVACLSMIAVVGWYQRPAREDVRQAASVVARDAAPGDVIVFLPWFMEIPFDAYAPEDGAIAGQVEAVWPEATWGTLAEDYPAHPQRSAYASTAENDRVWLVIRHDRIPGDDADVAGYERALLPDHELVVEWELDGLDVLLYERP